MEYSVLHYPTMKRRDWISANGAATADGGDGRAVRLLILTRQFVLMVSGIGGRGPEAHFCRLFLSFSPLPTSTLSCKCSLPPQSQLSWVSLQCWAVMHSEMGRGIQDFFSCPRGGNSQIIPAFLSGAAVGEEGCCCNSWTTQMSQETLGIVWELPPCCSGNECTLFTTVACSTALRSSHATGREEVRKSAGVSSTKYVLLSESC